MDGFRVIITAGWQTDPRGLREKVTHGFGVTKNGHNVRTYASRVTYVDFIVR